MRLTQVPVPLPETGAPGWRPEQGQCRRLRGREQREGGGGGGAQRRGEACREIADQEGVRLGASLVSYGVSETWQCAAGVRAVSNKGAGAVDQPRCRGVAGEAAWA